MRRSEVMHRMLNCSPVSLAARWLGVLCASGFAVALPAHAWEDDPSEASPVRRAPQVLELSERGIGKKIEDIAFQDLASQQRRLTEFADKRLTVIAITSTSCPLSKKYLPSLVGLAEEFSGQGVQFVVANPIAADGSPALQAIQERFGDHALLVMDAEQKLAAAIGATSTTDTIVIDAQQQIVYHGAIDDQYGFGYTLDAPRHTYLRDALRASLDGKPVLVAATDAPGCTLDLPPRPMPSSEPTYYGEIAALINKRCVECHRDGGVAPFSLASLDDVVSHAPVIRDVVERGVMPPWFAAPPEDGSPSPWANDRSLSDAEKQSLNAWIASGKIAGEASLAVEPTEFPEGWTIGQPDAIYEFAQPLAVKATGTMPYKNVFVETDQEEDRWVEAIEIRPGDRSVVHHVIVSVILPVDPITGKRREIDSASDGFWGAYVPGMSKLEYPEG